MDFSYTVLGKVSYIYLKTYSAGSLQGLSLTKTMVGTLVLWGYTVTPKGKINTGTVINSNCCMHKDTGSEIDMFVIDKPCSLLLCLLRDVYLILFFDTLEVMHFRGSLKTAVPQQG